MRVGYIVSEYPKVSHTIIWRQALAQAMRACLDASPDRLAAMGRVGQAAVRQRHDARKEGARLAGLFNPVRPDSREAQ